MGGVNNVCAPVQPFHTSCNRCRFVDSMVENTVGRDNPCDSYTGERQNRENHEHPSKIRPRHGTEGLLLRRHTNSLGCSSSPQRSLKFRADQKHDKQPNQAKIDENPPAKTAPARKVFRQGMKSLTRNQLVENRQALAVVGTFNERRHCVFGKENPY